MGVQNCELPQGELNELIHNEVAALEQTYEAGDILGVPAHCLVGTEIDFNIYMNSPTAEQKDALEKTRGEIAAQLAGLTPKNEAQAARKADWLKQIPELTPEELINYHIYRRLSAPTLEAPTPQMYFNADESPETTLEFVFGNGLYQTGYYDNPGSFEMRTQAAKPTIALQRVQRAIAVAHEVAGAYGATFHYTNDQTNFSVWVSTKEGLRTVHSLKTIEGQEVARKATAGILHATKDSMAMLHPPAVVSHIDAPMLNNAGPERGVALRVVPDRFEQRRAVGAKRHALGALVLMSGFAHGVSESGFDTDFVTKEWQDLLVPAAGFHKVRDLHLLRGLQESKIVDGRFVSPGVSEINITRTESMLASIVGAPVYDRVNGKAVIKALIGCISVNATGELQADEPAFEQVLELNKDRISVRGTPQETITDRLRRIRFIRSVVIKGNVKTTWPAGVTFHQELLDAVQAPSLGFIGQRTLEAVRQTLATTFTHEESVAQYFQQIFGDRSGSAGEKMAHIQDLELQFPDADHQEVVRLIKQETERIAKWAAASMAMREHQSQTDDYLQRHWKERCEQATDLLWVLEKYQLNKEAAMHKESDGSGIKQ